MTGTEHTFHLALRRWSSKTFHGESSEVHSSHFHQLLVALTEQRGRRVEEFRMLWKPLSTLFPHTNGELFKILEQQRESEQSRKTSSCNKAITCSQKGLPCAVHLPRLVKYVGMRSNPVEIQGVLEVLGSPVFILAANTHLFSVVGDFLHCVPVCVLASLLDTKNVLSSRSGLQESEAGGVYWNLRWGTF